MQKMRGSSLTLEILNNFNIEQFQNDLIGWFEKEQRDLPWRKIKIHTAFGFQKLCCSKRG